MTWCPHEHDERRGLGLVFLAIAVATLLGCLVLNCRKARSTVHFHREFTAVRHRA